MRAKYMNEDLEDILRPKSDEEIDRIVSNMGVDPNRVGKIYYTFEIYDLSRFSEQHIVKERKATIESFDIDILKEDSQPYQQGGYRKRFTWNLSGKVKDIIMWAKSLGDDPELTITKINLS